MKNAFRRSLRTFCK